MFFSITNKLSALRRDGMESRQQRKSSSSSRGPRLERRNAVKNIDYEAAAGESAPGRTRSLELSPAAYANGQTSFRIEGAEGEVDLLCRSLGLSGPDDFAISAAAWEARKARSSSDLLPRSRLLSADTPPATPASPPDSTPDSAPVGKSNEFEKDSNLPSETGAGEDLRPPTNTGGGVKIHGVRPPPVNLVLAPPPSMPPQPLGNEGSAWDILRSFAPDLDGGAKRDARRYIDSEEDEEYDEKEEEEEEEEEEELRVGQTVVNLTGSTSFSMSNDDDTSSSTTESMFVSPNGRFKRIIKSWQRGGLLGSGSFGTVYEAISDDGFFFAIKEVSLLDQGNNAKQCILQLEQEIALLSQFEHENIVQYFGSEKEEAKLFIFLELVTQGSLASLYQKYRLWDSQVRAYTRQILNGLSYLHDRNVVHRDIKCANILVDASGSVKLADFGLAKEVTIMNMLKSCKGSVYWMAPEVVNPKRTYGRAADIWSLGCTVIEMLTRQVPYPNLEWTQALFRIGRGEPPSIPNSLSREAQDFIRQCVQVNADDRPSAAELLEHPFVKRPLPVSSGSDGSSHHNERRS